jgi:cellulose biosynthesis protein BcsQ
MNLEDIKNRSIKQQEIDFLTNNIKELMKLFQISTELTLSHLYTFDPAYNTFDYAFSVNEELEIIDDPKEGMYEIFLKVGDQLFGRIEYDDESKPTKITQTIIHDLERKLAQRATLEKEIHVNSTTFQIYIVHDNRHMGKLEQLTNDLNAVFNVEIFITNDIHTYIDEIHAKSIKNIVIYLVSDTSLLTKDAPLLRRLNEFVIVIGPDSHSISLLCGSLNINHYLTIESYGLEELKSIIIGTKNTLPSKSSIENKIISFTGISGGMGVTTFAMNFANVLARQEPNANVLFFDLSTTKAISNLFLEQNALPHTTVIDLVNSNKFNIEKNLQNGLVKVTENFYAVTGIQKHIDKEYMEKELFIEKLLDYILKASDHFNYIIIDAGIADASNLKSTIYDISHDVWISTEMTLPYISKLKTFFFLMKRAGLQDKISILVNRFDSQNALSISDVSSILNIAKEDEALFDYKLPNDYHLLGKCWNHCELASNIDMQSKYMETMLTIMEDKGYIHRQSKQLNETKGLKNLFGMLG